MFNKTQLIEAMVYFTAKSPDVVANRDEKAVALSAHIRSMTSVCSQGKRDVAKLVSLITGLDITVHSTEPTFTPYVVRIQPQSKTPVLVSKSGIVFYSVTGSTIANNAFMRTTVVASKEDIIQFADKIWAEVEAYNLSKSFVQMLDGMVNTYLKTIKEK